MENELSEIRVVVDKYEKTIHCFMVLVKPVHIEGKDKGKVYKAQAKCLIPSTDIEALAELGKDLIDTTTKKLIRELEGT